MNNLAIIIGLQILFILGIVAFALSQRLTKRRILKHKKGLIKGMIYDKELEIEAGWILLKAAEKKLEEVKKIIRQNQDEIEKEKVKGKEGDTQKINTLWEVNKKLGCDGFDKNGEPHYLDKGRTAILENEMENHNSKISKSAMEREYLKVQFQAINRLVKKGFVKDFKKFEREGLAKNVLENIK
jgi:hypothetical protein